MLKSDEYGLSTVSGPGTHDLTSNCWRAIAFSWSTLCLNPCLNPGRHLYCLTIWLMVSDVVRRYVELGYDGDRPRSGRPATVNTRANRQWIKKRFMRNPRTPVRQMARETGLKETSLRRIVRKNLKMKPYKLKKVQKLTDENKKVRFERSKNLIHWDWAANGARPL
ncbi:unnamed protein product [Bursaphelenchus okinawaensis]|uniref:Transposase Tc1-like domain-containing protein n=1 Tax=Bursaphelenchus okinawaensis TaxID=465554 RepID=A0A811KBM6_9BILA|nr:unnamed protein product [Bursaphelenchus okinawaensis]CAG9098083.1 unnamed protein product [Bursaphelenchus okinawaensis]